MIVNFPGCCTAKVILDFGGTRTAEFRKGVVSRKAIIAEIMKCLLYKKEGLFCAITNNQQKIANKVLKEIGFSHSVWCEKKGHPDTKIRLWWISYERLYKGLSAIE